MLTQKNISGAEITDRFLNRSAIGVLLVALAFWISTVELLVGEQMFGLLDTIQLLLGLSVFIVILPAFWRLRKMKTGSLEQCEESDGYIASMFKEAGFKAFNVVIVSQVSLLLVFKWLPASLGAEFYLKLMMAISFTGFAVSFFYLTRDLGSDDTDDINEASDA